MTRDFIGYGAEPPHAGWPGDARIAVNFVINFEEGSELSYPAGDGVSEGGLTEMGGAELGVKGGVIDEPGLVERDALTRCRPLCRRGDHLHQTLGAGAGLRYYTPIGPIRLDVAVPTPRHPGDDAVEVYIGLGQAF